MIKGLNKNIGVEKSNQLIKRVFEERFGPKKVIAVHTLRKIDNI